ncbi:MAG: hypothetical protein R6X25_05550 [Candidatus Krumholzibacteriia bacterium]
MRFLGIVLVILGVVTLAYGAVTSWVGGDDGTIAGPNVQQLDRTDSAFWLGGFLLIVGLLMLVARSRRRR